jgi:FkbM family methyltransferase
VGNVAKEFLKRSLDRLGIDARLKRPYRDAALLFAHKAREFGIETVFDIGANVGQFARQLRANGYANEIMSFEPLIDAHRVLTQATASDPRWTVAPRAALGATRGQSTIFVSENSVSSSLLRVERSSVDAAPESGAVAEQSIDVRPLDEWHTPDLALPLAIKLDVQGYEMHVLDGAPKILADTRIVLAEMSLVELYADAPTLPEFYQRMQEEGFRCITITPGFANYRTNELLQVDGVFVRQ